MDGQADRLRAFSHPALPFHLAAPHLGGKPLEGGARAAFGVTPNPKLLLLFKWGKTPAGRLKRRSLREEDAPVTGLGSSSAGLGAGWGLRSGASLSPTAPARGLGARAPRRGSAGLPRTPERGAARGGQQGALTFPGDRQDVVAAGQRDAEVVVLGEAAAVQHVGPGEAEGGHDRGAALLHLLAERVARLDDLVQVVDADGGEEGAEELPGVGVALLLHQRDPGGGLLQHLLHRFVPQQVGQPHALVLDAPAQQHRGGDGLAVGALVGEVGLPEGEEPGGRAQAVGGQQEQGAEAALHRGALPGLLGVPGWRGVGVPGYRGAERAPAGAAAWQTGTEALSEMRGQTGVCWIFCMQMAGGAGAGRSLVTAIQKGLVTTFLLCFCSGGLSFGRKSLRETVPGAHGERGERAPRTKSHQSPRSPSAGQGGCFRVPGAWR